MADFCKQCSIALFGEDTGDLANLGPAGELGPGEGWAAICEDCRPERGFSIVVNQEGECIAAWCLKHGKPAAQVPA